MREVINKKYTDLIANNGEFRAFVEKMDKYSTDEIIALYGLKITSYSGLLEMPTLKQVLFVLHHQVI